MLANVDAHTASHACLIIDVGEGAMEFKRMELTSGMTVAAADAEALIDARNVSRGNEHRSPVAVGLHGAATARTAIADCIETIEGCILEEGVMDMTPFVFGLQDLDRLRLTDPPRSSRVMLQCEPCERFSHDQTDVEGQTGIFARTATRTIENDDCIGMFENDIPCSCERNDLLQIGSRNGPVNGDQPPSRVKGQHFTMIGVCESGCGFAGRMWTVGMQRRMDEKLAKRLEPLRQSMLTDAHTDIEVRESEIHIAVNEAKERSGPVPTEFGGELPC